MSVSPDRDARLEVGYVQLESLETFLCESSASSKTTASTAPSSSRCTETGSCEEGTAASTAKENEREEEQVLARSPERFELERLPLPQQGAGWQEEAFSLRRDMEELKDLLAQVRARSEPCLPLAAPEGDLRRSAELEELRESLRAVQENHAQLGMKLEAAEQALKANLADVVAEAGAWHGALARLSERMSEQVDGIRHELEPFRVDLTNVQVELSKRPAEAKLADLAAEASSWRAPLATLSQRLSEQVEALREELLPLRDGLADAQAQLCQRFEEQMLRRLVTQVMQEVSEIAREGCMSVQATSAFETLSPRKEVATESAAQPSEQFRRNGFREERCEASEARAAFQVEAVQKKDLDNRILELRTEFDAAFRSMHEEFTQLSSVVAHDRAKADSPVATLPLAPAELAESRPGASLVGEASLLATPPVARAAPCKEDLCADMDVLLLSHAKLQDCSMMSEEDVQLEKGRQEGKAQEAQEEAGAAEAQRVRRATLLAWRDRLSKVMQYGNEQMLQDILHGFGPKEGSSVSESDDPPYVSAVSERTPCHSLSPMQRWQRGQEAARRNSALAASASVPALDLNALQAARRHSEPPSASTAASYSDIAFSVNAAQQPRRHHQVPLLSGLEALQAARQPEASKVAPVSSTNEDDCASCGTGASSVIQVSIPTDDAAVDGNSRQGSGKRSSLKTRKLGSFRVGGRLSRSSKQLSEKDLRDLSLE